MYKASAHPSLLGVMPSQVRKTRTSTLNHNNDRYLNMTPEALLQTFKEAATPTPKTPLNQEITHKLLTGDIKDLVELVQSQHPTYHVVVLHGCNCMNNMGAGLAKRIKQLYPAAAQADMDTKSHDRNKLGTVSGATIDSNLSILNLYTQYAYGGNVVNVDYAAMRACFEQIVQNALPDYMFLIPKYIGCGLAGGDINIVAPMIKAVFKNKPYYLFDK